MKERLKIGLLELIIIIVIGIPLILTIRETKASIEKDGIYTTGTVTDLSRSRGKGAGQSHIRFEFEHNGRMISAINVNDKYFHYAVVGRKYLVRYVPEKIKKRPVTSYAYIFIQIPVPHGYTDQEFVRMVEKRDSVYRLKAAAAEQQ